MANWYWEYIDDPGLEERLAEYASRSRGSAVCDDVSQAAEKQAQIDQAWAEYEAARSANGTGYAR